MKKTTTQKKETEKAKAKAGIRNRTQKKAKVGNNSGGGGDLGFRVYQYNLNQTHHIDPKEILHWSQIFSYRD